MSKENSEKMKWFEETIASATIHKSDSGYEIHADSASVELFQMKPFMRMGCCSSVREAKRIANSHFQSNRRKTWGQLGKDEQLRIKAAHEFGKPIRCFSDDGQGWIVTPNPAWQNDLAYEIGECPSAFRLDDSSSDARLERIATAAMQGILAGDITGTVGKAAEFADVKEEELTASLSVLFARALIAELDKEEE